MILPLVMRRPRAVQPYGSNLGRIEMANANGNGNPDAAAVAAVQAAIAASNYASNGVGFGAFKVLAAPASNFQPIWWSAGYPERRTRTITGV